MLRLKSNPNIAQLGKTHNTDATPYLSSNFAESVIYHNPSLYLIIWAAIKDLFGKTTFN
jgi:hypothetical protein